MFVRRYSERLPIMPIMTSFFTVILMSRVTRQSQVFDF